MTPQRFIVQFSGGVSSWAAARTLVDQHGPDAVLILTADTNTEAPDWLPFVDACHRDLGCELAYIDNGGRTIWAVFHEERFIGNPRVDICSRVLKREPLLTWIETHCDPDVHRIVLGYDWDEQHRIDRARPRWAPWQIECPLTAVHRSKQDWRDEATRRGIPDPELYRLGFEHNNCNGQCVKAGQAHWARLLRVSPDRYAMAEAEENKLRAELGDVSILKDRRYGEARPLPLAKFREEREAQMTFDFDDWGACSCMETAL